MAAESEQTQKPVFFNLAFNWNLFIFVTDRFTKYNVIYFSLSSSLSLCMCVYVCVGGYCSIV